MPIKTKKEKLQNMQVKKLIIIKKWEKRISYWILSTFIS